MITEREREKEIQRRKSAGNLSIPSPQDGEVLQRFFTTPDRLYLYSQYGIYRVGTPDDIDPEVTQVNVPWTVNKYISFGSSEKIFGYLLGMERNVCDVAIVSQDEQNEFRSKLLPCLVSLNEIVYARNLYAKEFKEYKKSTKGISLSDLRDGTGIQVPTIDNFEVTFGMFFMSLKRFLINLFAVCEWACELQVGKGAKLDRLITRIKDNKKISKKIGDLQLLERHIDIVRVLNEVRNAYEHPSSSLYLEVRNVTFSPPSNLLEPSFRIVIYENIKASEWFQFSVNVERIYDSLCSLIRDILIVVGRVKTNHFAWEILPISEELIDKNLPVDCKFRVVHPNLSYR